MKVYFAADHAGFALKQELLNFVRGELSYEVEDCGAFESNPADDYPEFVSLAARKLAEDTRNNIQNSAIVIGASGQGEAITANRFKGVRCAVYYGKSGVQTDMAGDTIDMLTSVREHNHSNALSIGARFVTVEEAKGAVREWLSIPFSPEERHVRRIQKIDELAHE